MIVLGISPFGQNPAASILIDGKLIAFAEEERFIRIKSAYGRFPKNAVAYCIKEANISPADVTRVAVGWDSVSYTWKMPLIAASLWLRYGRGKKGTYDNAMRELVVWRSENVTYKIRFGLLSAGFKEKIPPVEYVQHHLAHAASTFYASGFHSATILVVDGSGEERATTIYKGDKREIQEVSHVNIPHSLGWVYAATTAYLGFKPYEDDGFVMGLAPYGKATQEMREKAGRMLQASNDMYSADPTFTVFGNHSYHEHFSDEMVQLFGSPRLPGDPTTQRHKNIAFAIQEKVEETIVSLARKGIEETGISDLCLAGGVAFNCKANGVLAQSNFINRLFVQPASHDAGAALGAAMVVAERSGDDPRFHMTHAQWGPSFSDKEIEQVLDEVMVPYKKKQNIANIVADAVAEGKIVARFNGRMEVGPRALGGRSILANPSIQGMNDIINKRVKYREPWRPFCPSMIDVSAKNYLVHPKETRFMTVTYSVPEDMRNDIRSVVHIDGTTRPHTVSMQQDPEYHMLLQEVGKKIGIPVVLNTSFNVKGEPIVCTPSDALRCFFSTGINALALGNYWIIKKQ